MDERELTVVETTATVSEASGDDRFEFQKIAEAMKTALIAAGMIALSGFLTGVGSALKDYCLKK